MTTKQRCLSVLATKDENGRDYKPSCQLAHGHDGNHRRGHFQDVMWSWADDDPNVLVPTDPSGDENR